MPNYSRTGRGMCEVVGAAAGGGLHYHEARPLQVPHQPVCRDPRHHIVRMMDPLSPLIPEREGEGLGDFVRSGQAEVRCIGHAGTIGDSEERRENSAGAFRSVCMLKCMPRRAFGGDI